MTRLATTRGPLAQRAPRLTFRWKCLLAAFACGAGFGAALTAANLLT